MKFKHLFIAATVAIFASCSAPKQIEYFQDVNNGTTLSLADDNQIKVQPGDKLSLIDPQRCAFGYFCKKDGVIGWYAGRIVEE